MSTRAQVRFATREAGQSFNEHASAIHAQFYVHSDGYPEGLGIEIAESLLNSCKINNWEIEYLDTRHGDLEYIYYVWQARDKETFISIFEVVFDDGMCDCCGQIKYQKNDSNCIFVGRASELIKKYKQNTNHDR